MFEPNQKPRINDFIHLVLNTIENMAMLYGERDVTLKEFMRDIKQAHAVYLYLLDLQQNPKY